MIVDKYALELGLRRPTTDFKVPADRILIRRTHVKKSIEQLLGAVYVAATHPRGLSDGRIDGKLDVDPKIGTHIFHVPGLRR